MKRYDLVPSFFRWPSFWDEDDWGGKTEDEVVVKASVAGVKPENVEITFEKGVMTVSAQEEEEKQEEEKRRYYRKSSRSYSYRVAVPGNVEAGTEPEAEIEDGVLKVRFEKAEEAKPKKIEIKAK